MSYHRHQSELAELERAGAAVQALDTFDVWEWRAGIPWRRVLEAGTLDETTRALVELAPCSSGAAFAAELETNPNRIGADELAELAALTVGPLADLTGRRHH